MSNIVIKVTDPDLEGCEESQVYTNKQSLTLEHIKDKLWGKAVPPRLGNFPHVSGNFKDVQIVKISNSNYEDNAGLDVSEVISNCEKGDVDMAIYKSSLVKLKRNKLADMVINLSESVKSLILANEKLTEELKNK